MKLVPLRGKHGIGKYAIVDDEDYDYVMQWPWHLTPNGYVVTGKNSVALHRTVIRVPRGRQSDHINRNKLDCRKSNLRICEPRENTYNRAMLSNNQSGFKGVRFVKPTLTKPWLAAIHEGKRYIYLGYHSTAVEAARAYNREAFKRYGEFAYLNEVPEATPPAER